MNEHDEEMHVYRRTISPAERTSLSLLSDMVPVAAEVLDVGCGSGALGEALSRTRSCTCDGVTINAQEAALAGPHYRNVQVADLESAQLADLFPGRRYDCIICADVLEHLRYPQRILEQCLDLLNPEGCVLISLPNASYVGLLIDLMHGEFRYRSEGLLDRTHLRFFTRTSLKRFVTEHGWQIDRLQVIERAISDSEFTIPPDMLPPAVIRYLLAQPDALTYQFLAAIRPIRAGRFTPPLEEHPRPAQAVFTAQLYWGENGAYSEERKCTATGAIGNLRQVLQFELPQTSGNAPRLRLDLADRPGFLHLHAIRLRDATGNICWRWQPEKVSEADSLVQQPQHQISWAPTLATAPNTELLLLTGDDPWIELPIAPETLAKCMQAQQSALEVEVGWPMSADYLVLADQIRALQTQGIHTEHILAKLQAEHHKAIAELQRLQPLAQEQIHLQTHNSQLSDALQQLQEHVKALENSRAVRTARKFAQIGNRLKSLHGAQASAASTSEHATSACESGSLTAAQNSPQPELSSSCVETKGLNPETTNTSTQPVPLSAPLLRTSSKASAVDIIIPVYKGLEDTRRCIESVLNSHGHTPARVIVINDASPDEHLVTWLRELAASEQRISLLENADNLGFVKTVNRGMALAPENDVLLLNSDTEVAGDWLDRLRSAAYRHEDIGTATPLSNNATICSYPRFCENNPLPQNYDTAAMHQLCATTHTDIAVDIPTAVGFCMYIRRDCMDQVGLFDEEHFGTGYGEENDFCMRASSRGWRHVLALDTFVRHVGGVSFGAAKTPREVKAQAVLRELHPVYEDLIAQHVAADPARPYRENLDLARLRSSSLPVILSVVHGIGGGTHRHVHEVSAHLRDRAIYLTLTPLADHRVRIQWDDPREAFTRDYHWLQERSQLMALLRHIGVRHIHYHHLLGVDPALMDLPAQLGVAYDFTAHDYYTACPQVAMVDEQQSYCGERGTDQCAACLKGRPAPTGETIEDWRLRHRLFLNGARNLLAPSKDAARRMQRYFPGAHIRFAPHLDLSNAPPLPQPRPRRIDPEANLRVFLVGALSRIKGGDTLETAAIEAAAIQAPIEFHLLGYPHVPLRQQPHASLTVHGAYEERDLLPLLKRLKPDLVWFPARWPETYSYTLSACLEAGLPILAPNLGAFPERLSGRPWSWLYQWSTPAGDCLKLLLDLREKHFVGGVPPLPTQNCVPAVMDDSLPAWSYDTGYLPA